MEFKINNDCLLISGNNDTTDYHTQDIPKDKAYIATLPCFTLMYKDVGDIYYYGSVPRPNHDEEYLRTLGLKYKKEPICQNSV